MTSADCEDEACSPPLWVGLDIQLDGEGRTTKAEIVSGVAEGARGIAHMGLRLLIQDDLAAVCVADAPCSTWLAKGHTILRRKSYYDRHGCGGNRTAHSPNST